MTRRYGRAQRGQRIRGGTPGGRWQTVTMLGAISAEGWTATMTVPAPTDSEVFLAYLNEVLCMALRPGQVVVMDNLAAHKIAGVAEAIAAVGARVLYLPPTPRTSTPLRHVGSSSNNACASLRPDHSQPWMRQSPSLSPASLNKRLPTASGIAAMHFVRSRTGLVSLHLDQSANLVPKKTGSLISPAASHSAAT